MDFGMTAGVAELACLHFGEAGDLSFHRSEGKRRPHRDNRSSEVASGINSTSSSAILAGTARGSRASLELVPEVADVRLQDIVTQAASQGDLIRILDQRHRQLLFNLKLLQASTDGFRATPRGVPHGSHLAFGFGSKESYDDEAADLAPMSSGQRKSSASVVPPRSSLQHQTTVNNLGSSEPVPKDPGWRIWDVTCPRTGKARYKDLESNIIWEEQASGLFLPEGVVEKRTRIMNTPTIDIDGIPFEGTPREGDPIDGGQVRESELTEPLPPISELEREVQRHAVSSTHARVGGAEEPERPRGSRRGSDEFGGSSGNGMTPVTAASRVRNPGGLEFSAKKPNKNHQETLLGRFENVVTSFWFEAIFLFLIFANTVVMCIEGQWRGEANGHLLNFSNVYLYPPHWGNNPEAVFSALEMGFGAVFALEVFLKLLALRKRFIFDYWNVLDAVIVAAWFVTLIDWAGDAQPSDEEASGGLDPLLLRLMRLARLLRLVRLVRSMRSFDSLVVMTTAMYSSVFILCWAGVVLTLVLMMCALFLQHMVDFYIRDEHAEYPKETRDEVFMYYGTFARSLLTMFEITLGNWMPPARALVENVNEYYFLFFVIHKLLIGFSVVSVITGVFIQETFKVSNEDDRIMMLHKHRALQTHMKKVNMLFDHLDEDGDGLVSLEEFRSILEDPPVKMWLAAMELNVNDIDTVFSLLDNGDGKLTPEELVAGVSRLKGVAKSIDVVKMEQRMGSMLENIARISRDSFFAEKKPENLSSELVHMELRLHQWLEDVVDGNSEKQLPKPGRDYFRGDVTVNGVLAIGDEASPSPKSGALPRHDREESSTGTSATENTSRRGCAGREDFSIEI